MTRDHWDSILIQLTMPHANTFSVTAHTDVRFNIWKMRNDHLYCRKRTICFPRVEYHSSSHMSLSHSFRTNDSSGQIIRSFVVVYKIRMRRNDAIRTIWITTDFVSAHGSRLSSLYTTYDRTLSDPPARPPPARRPHDARTTTPAFE